MNYNTFHLGELGQNPFFSFVLHSINQKFAKVIKHFLDVLKFSYMFTNAFLAKTVCKSRLALGVHTIITMQRPGADLLKSALKAKLRVKISGRQADAINAKLARVIGSEEIDSVDRG
ncbi:hypothetical protein [Priestia megaterium]